MATLAKYLQLRPIRLTVNQDDALYNFLDRSGPRGPQGIQGEPGTSPSREEIVELILALMPPAPEPIMPTDEQLRDIMRPLIPQVKDGTTPTEQELTTLIKPLIPKVPTRAEFSKMIQSMMPDMPVITAPTDNELRAMILQVLTGSEDIQQTIYQLFPAGLIRDKLMTLVGNDRLDASAIKNLPAKKLFGGLIRSAVTGSGATGTTTSETFTTAGGTETFTLAATPSAIVLVVLGANTLFETDDYTVAGANVTLTNTDIPAGMKVKVIYTTA